MTNIPLSAIQTNRQSLKSRTSRRKQIAHTRCDANEIPNSARRKRSLFLKLPFAFFDFNEPRVFFFADYLEIMILFAMLGFGIMRLLKQPNQK